MIKVFYLVSVIWNGQALVLGDAYQRTFDTLAQCNTNKAGLELDQIKQFPGALGYHECLEVEFTMESNTI